MYTTIKARVIDQTLQVTSVPALASGGDNMIRLEVTFDAYWKGFGKTAIFYRDASQVYHVVMRSDACIVPREVMTEAGKLYMGILGVSGSTTRTTEVVTLSVSQGAITGLSPLEPLPDVYRQMLSEYGVLSARVNNLVSMGPAGDTELLDVRVGANGVIYGNAGDAVRAQHNSVKQAAERALSGYAVGSGYLYDLSSVDMWEQGWISSATGATGNTGVDNDVYIRTADYLPDTVEFVTAENGRRLHVYRYSKIGEFVDRLTATYTLTEFAPDHDAYKYKLALTNSSSTSNIYTMAGPTSPEDAIYVHFLANRKKVATSADVERCVNLYAYVNGYMTDHNHVGLWEQGYLYTGTGAPEYLATNSLDYANYIRTSDFIAKKVECVHVRGEYVLDVFRYTPVGVFVDMLADVSSLVLDHKAYKYKARIRSTPAAAIDKTHAAFVHFFGNRALNDNPPDIDFGAPPRLYYQNGLSAHDDFTASTTTSLVYAKYNALMAAHTDYITRQEIGVASDGQKLYAYTFTPAAVTGDHAETKPAKILIVGGQHGFEKANVFGTYYFVEDMCNNWLVSPVLEYFRHNVTLVVVPVLNPSGFDTSSYKNSNGVNLNRNYDHDWVLVGDTASEYYGGAEAFDQPETQAIRDFILSNTDAAFVVDSHTKGKSSVSKYTDINWIACSKSDTLSYKKLAKACRRHISTITAHFNADYSLGLDNSTACGYYDGFTGGESTTPSLDNWCVDNGLISMTFEGFNGFPGKPAHTAETHKANAELVGNWLLTLCDVYGG